MHQRDALAERGIENGFPFFDFHFDAGGLQEDRVDRAGGQRVLRHVRYVP